MYNRVAGGELVLGDPEEALRFVEAIREVKRRKGWTVDPWRVDSNHHQLANWSSVLPLWRGMHRVQNGYSRGYTRRHGRTGGLFQSRCRERPVSRIGRSTKFP